VAFRSAKMRSFAKRTATYRKNPASKSLTAFGQGLILRCGTRNNETRGFVSLWSLRSCFLNATLARRASEGNAVFPSLPRSRVGLVNLHHHTFQDSFLGPFCTVECIEEAVDFVRRVVVH
jgi:hypothetical protein